MKTVHMSHPHHFVFLTYPESLNASRLIFCFNALTSGIMWEYLGEPGGEEHCLPLQTLNASSPRLHPVWTSPKSAQFYENCSVSLVGFWSRTTEDHRSAPSDHPEKNKNGKCEIYTENKQSDRWRTEVFLFPAALKRTTGCVGFLSAENAKKRFVFVRIIWTPAAVTDEHCLNYTCSFSFHSSTRTYEATSVGPSHESSCWSRKVLFQFSSSWRRSVDAQPHVRKMPL